MSLIKEKRLTAHRMNYLADVERFIEFAELQGVGEVFFDCLTREIVLTVYWYAQVDRRWCLCFMLQQLLL